MVAGDSCLTRQLTWNALPTHIVRLTMLYMGQHRRELAQGDARGCRLTQRRKARPRSHRCFIRLLVPLLLPAPPLPSADAASAVLAALKARMLQVSETQAAWQLPQRFEVLKGAFR